MTITFKSYSEIAALQNTLLFANHLSTKINDIREISSDRADQMEGENDIWDAARAKLSQAKPDVPFEIWLG